MSSSFSLFMPTGPQSPSRAGHLHFKLPGGQTLALDTLDVALGTLMDIARGVLRDDQIAPEHFGVTKHFVFVNRSTGTLLDEPALGFYPLHALRLRFGQEIELCLTPS